ncbi:MAG: IS110 family transposase [Gammaproteobacteria bacterium]|nr:MAG: IS110 family transposase [Gammaproteobacteria bacterium]
MTNPLLVGVDVHRKTNTVCLMDGQGREVAPRFTVDNNLPGTETFVQKVAQQVIAGDFDALHIAAEATGWYWWHFFQTLERDPFLNRWPLELYSLNPRLTANFKRTYTDQDKTDPLDAFVIADRLRLGRDLPPPFHYDERFFPLRLLTRYRFHLVHNLAREKAYCLTILYLKASEYTRIRPFSNVFGAASRAVLQEFTSLEEIAAIPFEELVEFIDRKGKHRFPDPTQNARKLRQVIRDSYPLPEALQQPVHLILGMSLQHITFLERQEKRLRTAIAQQLAPIPHTLDTIPGFGPVFSAGIIAEIGGIERFDYNQAKVAKYAGLKWRKHRSADFEAEETRLSRTGNRYLRYYFCEAANRVRMCDPEYAAYYDRKFHEVRKHQHKRSLVLTARKLVRLVVRLLTTNQPYRPRRR